MSKGTGIGQTVERQMLSDNAPLCNRADRRDAICNAAESEAPSAPLRLTGLAIQNDAAG